MVFFFFLSCFQLHGAQIPVLKLDLVPEGDTETLQISMPSSLVLAQEQLQPAVTSGQLMLRLLLSSLLPFMASSIVPASGPMVDV